MSTVTPASDGVALVVERSEAIGVPCPNRSCGRIFTEGNFERILDSKSYQRYVTYSSSSFEFSSPHFFNPLPFLDYQPSTSSSSSPYPLASAMRTSVARPISISSSDRRTWTRPSTAMPRVMPTLSASARIASTRLRSTYLHSLHPPHKSHFPINCSLIIPSSSSSPHIIKTVATNAFRVYHDSILLDRLAVTLSLYLALLTNLPYDRNGGCENMNCSHCGRHFIWPNAIQVGVHRKHWLTDVLKANPAVSILPPSTKKK